MWGEPSKVTYDREAHCGLVNPEISVVERKELGLGGRALGPSPGIF